MYVKPVRFCHTRKFFQLDLVEKQLEKKCHKKLVFFAEDYMYDHRHHLCVGYWFHGKSSELKSFTFKPRGANAA